MHPLCAHGARGYILLDICKFEIYTLEAIYSVNNNSYNVSKKAKQIIVFAQICL